MQGKQKTIMVKRCIDVCMTILLLCLMAYQVTGEQAMIAKWKNHNGWDTKQAAGSADGGYIEHEIQNSGPGTLMFALVPEHMTGKLVREA